MCILPLSLVPPTNFKNHIPSHNSFCKRCQSRSRSRNKTNHFKVPNTRRGVVDVETPFILKYIIKPIVVHYFSGIRGVQITLHFVAAHAITQTILLCWRANGLMDASVVHWAHQKNKIKPMKINIFCLVGRLGPSWVVLGVLGASWGFLWCLGAPCGWASHFIP